MIWMLIGLVLTSMIVGALSSAFNLEFVLQPSQVKESDKVTIVNTFPTRLHRELAVMFIVHLRLEKVCVFFCLSILS